MDAEGRRRMFGLVAVYDFAVAAACLLGFVVALVAGLGAASVLFLLAAVGWFFAGVAFRRRARRGS